VITTGFGVVESGRGCTRDAMTTGEDLGGGGCISSESRGLELSLEASLSMEARSINIASLRLGTGKVTRGGGRNNVADGVGRDRQVDRRNLAAS
jgi:hypothetical protein